MAVARATGPSLLRERLGVTEAEPQSPIADPTLPFAERVVVPAMARLGALILLFTPQVRIERINRQLDRAGNPPGLTAQSLLAIQVLMGLVAVLFDVLVVVVWSAPTLVRVIVAVVVLAMVYLGPKLYLRSLVNGRKRAILKAYPTVLDLLVVSVEAGLTLDAAMSRVGEQFGNPMAQELVRVLNEINVGRSRAEALEEMAARLDIGYVNRFVQAIVQSEELGVGIAHVLRQHAREYRIAHRQDVQAKAGQVPIKMIFPMVGCIFPTLWIPLIGPAVLLALKLTSNRP